MPRDRGWARRLESDRGTRARLPHGLRRGGQPRLKDEPLRPWPPERRSKVRRLVPSASRPLLLVLPSQDCSVFCEASSSAERLTNQIAMELTSILETEDVAVIIDAKHPCVSSRGIKDETSATVTSYYGGIFNTPDKIAELQNYLSQ